MSSDKTSAMLGHAEDEKEEAMIYEDSSGLWHVNHSKLRSFLAAEGFSYTVLCALSKTQRVALLRDFPRRGAKDVIYLTLTEYMKLESSGGHSVNEMYFKFGTLVSSSSRRPIAVNRGILKRHIVKWLEDCNECIVCFEEFIAIATRQPLKNQLIDCDCGVPMCFGCFIDLLQVSETEMTVMCPNCRGRKGPMANLWFIVFLLLQQKSEEGMSSAQRSFIAEQMGIDPKGDLVLPCTAEEMWQFIDSRVAKHGFVVHKLDFESDQNEAVIFKETRAFFGRKAKAALSRVSAEGSAVVKHTFDGCANCGKSFWDKRERKRAPKCLKCKRAAYCCAKCRKRHWKTHASECKAMKPKSKRKAKRKPKKGGCAPY